MTSNQVRLGISLGLWLSLALDDSEWMWVSNGAMGSNGLNCNVPVNSHEGGLLAHLGLDIMALLDKCCVNNGPWGIDTLLDVVCCALLLWDVPGHRMTLLLGHGVANIVKLGLGDGFGHGVAHLLWHG